MKKFLKGCFVIAIIFILLGFIIAIATTAAGGGKSLVRMAQNGMLTIDAYDFIYDYSYEVNIDDIEPLYDLDDVEIFDYGKEVLSGDIPLMEIPASDISDMDINLGGGEFYIKNSPDDKFYIEAENAEKLQVYAEDEEMYLKVLRNSIDGQDTEVILYIPGLQYNNIEVSLGAGTVIFETSLAANSFNGEVGAGQMIVKDIVCNELDVNVGAGEFVGKNVYTKNEAELKVGAGHIRMNGTVDNLLEVMCSMGGVEVTLAHNENEFNYEIEAMAGSVQVGDDEFSGLATEKTIDNNASKKIDIECSMGAVVVEFDNRM